jgi:hypothetical protein
MCLAVVVVAAMSVVGGGGRRQGWATDQTWDIDLLCDVSDAWTFQVNFMYDKFL